MIQNRRFKTVQRHYRYILSVPKLAKKLIKHLQMTDIDYTSAQTKNVLQSFRLSMQKNYKEIPRDWRSLTRNNAFELYLEPYLSKQGFYNYVEDGYFRSNQEGNVYAEEVERYRDLCAFIYKIGLKQENVNGKKRYTFFYSKQAKFKLGTHNELVRSGVALLKTPWFSDMQGFLDLSD